MGNKKEFDRKRFEELCIGKWDDQNADSHQRAFNAALHYEMNCRAKYDFPDNRPSLPIPKGERIDDFARQYGTTVNEMKERGLMVDNILDNKTL